jgi:protein-L-isoaspartate(D-aspartate) O-methyltransferase
MTQTRDVAQDASELRAAMVERLVADGVITTARLEAAMREVPRHAFAPGVELAAAYADDVVRYRTDEHGVCLSSISAPWMQAAMIEAAGIAQGMCVLEVGSGGYNAAFTRQAGCRRRRCRGPFELYMLLPRSLECGPQDT